jgi:competence protein ComEC
MDTLNSDAVRRVSDKPAVAMAVCFSLGIACSLPCPYYSFAGLAVACLSLIGGSLLALRRNRPAMALTLSLSAIAISGLLIALAHRDSFPDNDLRPLLARGIFDSNEYISFEGCAVTDGEQRIGEMVSTIEMRGLLRKDRWIACSGKGILHITESDPEHSPAPRIDLKRGDRVRGWASWRAPSNYENPGSTDIVGLLSRRGIYAVGRAKSSRLIEVIPCECSGPWTQLAAAVGIHVRTSLEPIKDKGNGQPAAILASLIIGDYSGINNFTREVFQNSGTLHVLVVSGLHVAWIAGLLLQLFKHLGMPERICYLLAAGAIFFYTCVVGFQASITRCLWVFILYLIGRMLFRKADALNILLASALILLAIQPDWLFETGFQLSFLSVAAIVTTAAPFIRNYLKPIWTPLRHAGDSKRLFVQQGSWYRRGRYLRVRCEMVIEEATERWPVALSRMLFRICHGAADIGLAIGSAIALSISVQIWLEPLLAHSFNRLSWIAPLANLVIVPFSSIVLGVGILASSAAGFPVCGPLLMQFAGFLASLLLSVATWITKIPGAWQRCPTPSIEWILAGICLLFIWRFFEWRRFWIPCSYIAVMLACLSCGSVPFFGALWRECRSALSIGNTPMWGKDASVLSFTFLDVGEGDSIAIRFPDNRQWLLDAGGLRQAFSQKDEARTFDVGEAVVSRYLWHEWITKLDRLILSHTDSDHAGGIPAIMKNFRVAEFNYTSFGADRTMLEPVLGIAHENRIPVKLRRAGMEETLGPVTVRAIHPAGDLKEGSANENSLVLQFTYKHFTALLTGDLDKSGERAVLTRPVRLHSELLKVGHHGSRFGTSNAFLDRVQPRWAVVSAGRNNPFGHPSPEVLSRLRQHGARLFMTLKDGAITFETDGDRYAIRSFIRGILEQGELGNKQTE